MTTQALPPVSIFLKPANQTSVKSTLTPQVLNELNQRADWLIQLVTDIGLVLAGTSPYPSAGIPLVFAGNLTTLSTSTVTLGGPLVVNGTAQFNDSPVIGTNASRKTL